MPLFFEHNIESGSMNYYSPGDELDDLPKALLIACFAARKYLDKPKRIIVGGQMSKQIPDYFGVGGGFEEGIPMVRFHWNS